MTARSRRPSPILGAASALIDEASGTLVTGAGHFRHTFEAELITIEPDADQPRKVFSEADINSLAISMREQGQLQPILLRRVGRTREKWFIVAGERRWRAAKLIGWTMILAIEHDGDPEVAMLVENLQRLDLSPIEEARGLQRLIDGKNWTQDRAAKAIGKSKSDVSGMLRILTLPRELLEAVLTSKLVLPKNVLVELARVDRVGAREHLIRLARQGRLTISAIRSVALDASSSENVRSRVTDTTVAPSGCSGARFSFRGLSKVTLRLREARDADLILKAKEREYLEALRAEIDGLLATKAETHTGQNVGRKGSEKATHG